MAPDAHLILTKEQVKQKIKRIAFEIYEQNYKEKELVVAGLAKNGYTFAKLLQKELSSISELQITLVKIQLDKSLHKQSEITLDIEPAKLKNKVIVLVDDVLNTGRTLAYSLKPFLNIDVKKLQTAVIVDRQHQSFPITADYVGYSLATTLKEHIEVDFSRDRYGVYLH